MAYTRVGDAVQASDDGTIWTAQINRSTDNVTLTVTFNKNMSTADAQAAVTKAFQAYDQLRTRTNAANSKIDTILVGL